MAFFLLLFSYCCFSVVVFLLFFYAYLGFLDGGFYGVTDRGFNFGFWRLVGLGRWLFFPVVVFLLLFSCCCFSTVVFLLLFFCCCFSIFIFLCLI